MPYPPYDPRRYLMTFFGSKLPSFLSGLANAAFGAGQGGFGASPQTLQLPPSFQQGPALTVAPPAQVSTLSPSTAQPAGTPIERPGRRSTHDLPRPQAGEPQPQVIGSFTVALPGGNESSFNVVSQNNLAFLSTPSGNIQIFDPQSGQPMPASLTPEQVASIASQAGNTQQFWSWFTSNFSLTNGQWQFTPTAQNLSPILMALGLGGQAQQASSNVPWWADPGQNAGIAFGSERDANAYYAALNRYNKGNARPSDYKILEQYGYDAKH